MSDKNGKIELIRKKGQKLGFWTHGYGYPSNCRRVFNDVELNGKRVLEIGCGKGLLCIWASIHGASQVLGLEPLEDGSGSFDSSRIYREFKEMSAAADLHNIEMLPLRIQDYAGQEDYFDVVLMIASVNHIDEDGCIHLGESEKARESYISVFRQISRMIKKGGKIILMDCSNKNLFDDIGVVNPMAKTIEWFKHRSPECWAELLSKSGFGEAKISWPSGRYLRYMGINNRNKFLSYLTDSAFRLEMTCLKNDHK